MKKKNLLTAYLADQNRKQKYKQNKYNFENHGRFFTILYLVLFSLFMLSILGCAQILPVPTHRKPSDGAQVFKPKNNWTIRDQRDIPKFIGKVYVKEGVLHWDMRGAVIDGINQSGKGNQDQNQEPLFRAQVPFVLMNGFVRNNKDGASFFKENSGIVNVTFTNIGEDAITLHKGAKDFTMIDVELINHPNGDKSFQGNDAGGLYVDRTLIYGGITCMRIGSKRYNNSKEIAVVKNSDFIGCDTAFNVEALQLQESGNIYEGVSKKVVRGD